ncbi:MAG: VWA domain-containing protein [Polyangiaceae bacterium]
MLRSRWLMVGSWAIVTLACGRNYSAPAREAPGGAPSGPLATSSTYTEGARQDLAAAPEEKSADSSVAPSVVAEPKMEAAPPPPAVARAGGAGKSKGRPLASVKPSNVGAPSPTSGALVAPSAPPPAPPVDTSNESYSHIADNHFVSPRTSPLSTFSVDVDTAAYANVRRFIEQGALPPADAVRIEELINYFTYDYADPKGEEPFSVTTELSTAPWNTDHQLLLVGLQGKRLPARELPPRNLVFLVDVSGSMGEPNKLPLLKYALTELVNTLGAKDRVSMVVYAGASGVVLEPTPANEKQRILSALDRLEAGGSTNGADGINAAYALAERAFDAHGVNRVVLATDGDFNVGVSSEGELVRLIEQKRNKGVSLSVLGFGMGNYKDANLEKLADHGNGNYAYIDSRAEARKVLVEQGGSTLVTIAKDVKIQVEWNPRQVASYRLIGYENRKLAAEDFNNDKKDAGDIGAGHSVTALYEIIPPGAPAEHGSVDALKYQTPSPTNAAQGSELATIKLRYKRPRTDNSLLTQVTVQSDARALQQTSDNFRFASAVADFGMLLRKSEHRGNASYALSQKLAQGARGADKAQYRNGFITLVARAAQLDTQPLVKAAR